MDDELLVFAAGVFAAGAHYASVPGGQKRKYTGEPYIHHPTRVAALVEGCSWRSIPMLAASLLHDVVEDTGVPLSAIEHHFGDVVAGFVFELTDYFTPENFPDMNREERKRREAERYVEASFGAKTIKLADMIDNTESIGEHDPEFLKTYGPEKRRLLESLKDGDEGLWAKADEILKGYGY